MDAVDGRALSRAEADFEGVALGKNVGDAVGVKVGRFVGEKLGFPVRGFLLSFSKIKGLLLSDLATA